MTLLNILNTKDVTEENDKQSILIVMIHLTYSTDEYFSYNISKK